jgi:hypothetical protein
VRILFQLRKKRLLQSTFRSIILLDKSTNPAISSQGKVQLRLKTSLKKMSQSNVIPPAFWNVNHLEIPCFVT